MWFHWDHHGWGVGWWLGHGGMSQESHLCDDQDGNVAILNSQLFECTGILKFIQRWYIYIYVGWNSMVQWSPYYWMDGDTWRGLQLPSSSWSRRTPPFFLWGGAAYSWDEAWHRKNKMQPTNPKQIIWTVLYIFPLLLYKCIVNCGMWKKVECKARSVKKVECWVGNVVCRVCSGDCGV